MAILSADYPEPALLDRLLRQYATVQLSANIESLSDGDQRALRHLVEAARWVDRIYWKQRSEIGWALKQRLSASRHVPSDLRRLVDLGFGPWDVFDNDRPFWGDVGLPPGGNHYPADLTRDELDRYLAGHEDDREALLSPTTQVVREGAELVAVPYSNAFREELHNVADALIRASREATHPGFARFLLARAEGLRSGSLWQSEAEWIDVGDSVIDIAIGPYEVYHDGLLGLKRSYEATVLVRHPFSNRLAELEAVTGELASMLPGAVAPLHERQRVVIGVYDVVFAAGATNIGAKPVAAMLPNDETVRREHGSRLLLFRNVMSAKFAPILKPIAERTMRLDQSTLVQQDAFVLHTLFHEMAHALVARADADEEHEGSGPTANERLRERYSTIEECRADLVGLVFLQRLAHRGAFSADVALQAVVTFVAGCLRVLRFGRDSDYARAAAITLSHLLASGAIEQDREDRLVVDVARTVAAVVDLAKQVQAIATDGDYEDAGALVARLGSLPRGIAAALAKLDGLPIDLAFTFDPSFLG